MPGPQHSPQGSCDLPPDPRWPALWSVLKPERWELPLNPPSVTTRHQVPLPPSPKRTSHPSVSVLTSAATQAMVTPPWVAAPRWSLALLLAPPLPHTATVHGVLSRAHASTPQETLHGPPQPLWVLTGPLGPCSIRPHPCQLPPHSLGSWHHELGKVLAHHGDLRHAVPSALLCP